MENNAGIPQLACITQCSAMTGLSSSALRTLIKNKKIKHIKVGKKCMINVGSLIEYINKGDSN